MRAWEHVTHALAFFFRRLVEEVHGARALRATEHLTPHRVLNAALGLAVAVQRFVHPADVLLHGLEQLFARLGEGIDIEGDVVVCANEGGCRRQVVEYRATRTPFGCCASFLFPGQLQLVPVAGRRCAAPLCGHPSHPRAGEAVQYHIARLGVMQNRRHNGQMRHLGVVAVCLVEGVGLAHTHVDCQRLTAVFHCGVVGFAVMSYELRQPGVRAGGVIGRIGHCENGRVRSFRKAILLAERRVFQLLGQQPQEMLPPRVIAGESLAKAFDGAAFPTAMVVQ
ncbi:hypothetical protein RHSP_04831 [Rhizobium freirei PRF 81]|uniref:Uncharacterized protein n=1 Tax=Rhizobium freirei PRF 81 TaxID=363754 RepID=N6U7E2_9HYPH|nr:hypothetical protein RHSP_04831 [Rhizobium freirei PRF 81]